MTVSFCCLAETFDPTREAQFLVDGPAVDSDVGQCAAIILSDANEARAEALLEAGAQQVLIGEAVLIDSGIIERLVTKFGKERIGLYVPVQNLAVDWAFETVSNADFKVVTPSICEPTWEVLRADGSGTGTHAEWWIGQMVERGAQTVLLCADIEDDIDLNLCAGLVEKLGDQLWISPRANCAPPLADWIAFGQIRQLALPPDLYQQRDKWQCPANTDDAIEEAS